MWYFLFALALVPLCFYWSDSVTTLFPQLASYFPAKTAKASNKTTTVGAEPNEGISTAVQAGRWLQDLSDKGYVAWVVSKDGQARLAVGCQKRALPSIQITRVDRKAVPDSAILNYEYGEILIERGLYTGDDVVDAVAQFENVQFRVSGQTAYEFSVDAVTSGSIARAVADTCTPTPPQTIRKG